MSTVVEQYAEAGEVIMITLPHSEVCVHMGVAGKCRAVLIVRSKVDGRDVFLAQVLKPGHDVCYHPNHREPVELISPVLRERHAHCGDYVAGYRVSNPIAMEEAGFHSTSQGWGY